MDKIPTEILMHILLFCSQFKQQRKVRKSLCCVCHFWHTAINASPFFWTEVGLHRTTDELLEILLRNPNGPLDVSWTPSNPNKLMDIAAMERMAKISPQSRRWRSLVVAGQMTDQIQSQLIQVPAPRLINFSVVGSFDPPIGLSIPEAGEPLSELILGCAALDWGNPRLRGLRCLRLHNLGAKAPTVERLHTILSASPGLEILDLASWTDESQNQPPLEKLGAILLPSLTTLAVQEVPPTVQRTLLSRIQAPNCKYIRLPTISQVEFLDSYPLDELGRLWQGPLSTVPQLAMFYDRAYGTCTLTHREREIPPQPNTRESSLKFAQRRGVYIRTEAIIIPSMGPNALHLNEKKIRKFIQQVVQPALNGRNVEVQLTLQHLWPRLTVSAISPPTSVATDLLLNMPLVTHLRIHWTIDPLEVLPFLSARQPVRTMDGEAGQGLWWPVPLMETLTVHYTSASRSNVLKALNGLMSQRGSGIHGEVAALKHIFLQNGLEPPLEIWDSEQGWNDETMTND